MDSNDQPVRFFMPDGFKEEDLHAPEYSGPLSDAAAPMAEHARKLATDMDEADFDPSTSFDATLNGAFTMIDDFFETLVGYAQGRVPAFAADALVSATNALVEKQQRRFGDVCAAEINAVGQAFRKSHLLWSRCAPTPRKPRGVYVRLLFKSKEEIVDAIGDLACAFAKHQAQKPPPGKDGGAKAETETPKPPPPPKRQPRKEPKFVKTIGRFLVSANCRDVKLDDEDKRWKKFLPYYDVQPESARKIVRELVAAYNDGKSEGWRPSDKNWRSCFKRKYASARRFKEEQIEVGTRSNGHLGEWRIIPDEEFDAHYRKRISKRPSAT